MNVNLINLCTLLPVFFVAKSSTDEHLNVAFPFPRFSRRKQFSASSTEAIASHDASTASTLAPNRAIGKVSIPPPQPISAMCKPIRES